MMWYPLCTAMVWTRIKHRESHGDCRLQPSPPPPSREEQRDDDDDDDATTTTINTSASVPISFDDTRAARTSLSAQLVHYSLMNDNSRGAINITTRRRRWRLDDEKRRRNERRRVKQISPHSSSSHSLFLLLHLLLLLLLSPFQRRKAPRSLDDDGADNAVIEASQQLAQSWRLISSMSKKK